MKLELAEDTRKLATALLARFGGEVTTCAVFVESYVRHVGAKAGQGSSTAKENEEDQLAVWFTEQVLAVPQIVAALQYVSADESNIFTDVAATILPEILADADRFIESLFRAWTVWAQKDLEKRHRADPAEALFQ